MARLAISEVTAFSDAAVTFFGGKPGGAPRTGGEIHRASVGTEDGDVEQCDERNGVRGRTGVRGSPGSGCRSGLIVSTDQINDQCRYS